MVSCRISPMPVIERAYSRDPRDVGARDLAVQALPLILNANLPSTQKAIAILDRAIDMDPADATAVAFLAYCHAQRANYIATASLAADRDAALNLSQRAGMLDNGDPLVLTARGAVAAWALQNDEADALVTRALSIDPTSAWAWMLRGHTRRGFAGAAERAIADYQRSIQLRGPGISASSCIYSIGAAHWNAGRFEETVRWTRRALAENPNAAWMHRHLSCAAAKLGDMTTVAYSVDCMRRAQPHLTVSLLVENYPVADRDWLEAITRCGCIAVWDHSRLERDAAEHAVEIGVKVDQHKTAWPVGLYDELILASGISIQVSGTSP